MHGCPRAANHKAAYAAERLESARKESNSHVFQVDLVGAQTPAPVAEDRKVSIGTIKEKNRRRALVRRKMHAVRLNP